LIEKNFFLSYSFHLFFFVHKFIQVALMLISCPLLHKELKENPSYLSRLLRTALRSSNNVNFFSYYDLFEIHFFLAFS
jgi:hypothetical protein